MDGLGLDAVILPMGLLPDLQMPVGLTFAGPAYADTKLLALAAAFERLDLSRRVAPPRTPVCGDLNGGAAVPA